MSSIVDIDVFKFEKVKVQIFSVVMMTVVRFETFDLRSTICNHDIQLKQSNMAPVICPYCEDTLSSQQNYTKHLRYYSAKPEADRKKHPGEGSDEFQVLKKTLKMWKKPPVIEGDSEAEAQAKRARKAATNARYYDKKRSRNQNIVREEINKAL
jgi:hypothetical protein